METELKGTGAHRILEWLLKEGWIIIDPATALGIDGDIVLRSLEAHFPELSAPDPGDAKDLIYTVNCGECGSRVELHVDSAFRPSPDLIEKIEGLVECSCTGTHEDQGSPCEYHPAIPRVLELLQSEVK